MCIASRITKFLLVLKAVVKNLPVAASLRLTEIGVPSLLLLRHCKVPNSTFG